MINFGLVFISLSLSLGMNVEEGFLRRMGFDPDVLLVAALAFVVSGLIVHRRLALIVAVVVLSFGANVPVEEAARLGYDPDVLLAALFALVTVPFFAKWVDGIGF
jgi:hypothetical protein